MAREGGAGGASHGVHGDGKCAIDEVVGFDLVAWTWSGVQENTEDLSDGKMHAFADGISLGVVGSGSFAGDVVGRKGKLEFFSHKLSSVVMQGDIGFGVAAKPLFVEGFP